MWCTVVGGRATLGAARRNDARKNNIRNDLPRRRRQGAWDENIARRETSHGPNATQFSAARKPKKIE